MILNKNIQSSPDKAPRPRSKNKLRQAAAVAAGSALLPIVASFLPGPTHESNPDRTYEAPTEEAPATTTYEAQDGDDITSITQRELINSGINPAEVDDINEYVDPNVELNGGNTMIIPGQVVTVIDIPNVAGSDLQNANNQPPVDQSKV